MRDDARALDARVLGLNMKHPPAVADVVVEAENWRGDLSHSGAL
jgi:hypothetical protein